MNYKIITIISALVLLFNINVNAQTEIAHKIEIHAPSLKGNMAYLASYWEGNTYISDSTMVPDNGTFVIAGERKLPAGQYLLFIKPDTQIDILIDKEQSNIQINVDAENPTKSTITGNSDTELFWNYIAEFTPYYSKQEELAQKIQDTDTSESDRLKNISEYSKVVKQIKDSNDAQIKKHAGTWFSAFVKSAQQIDPPYEIAETSEQALENKEYIKKHYFDNIDLTDERMWGTNILTRHIDTYLKEWVIRHPDTIAKEASWLVSKTIGNKVCFERMLSYLSNTSATSPYMGMENVWAKLAEDYIFDKNLEWIDDVQYNNLQKEYALIKLNRMGMKAQNLKLYTVNNDSINTNEVEADYTLLYFYSTSCAHCETEVPILRNEVYPKYKDKGLKVIAINLAGNVEHWEQFVDKHHLEEWDNVFDPHFKSEYWLKYNTSGTPSLYLLDKDKIIIAKKISAKNLDEYLEKIVN